MISISTVAPAASFASSVLEQFKPSRAPYLLAASIGCLFIGLALESPTLTFSQKLMVVVPIYVFVAFLALLSFYFKPFEDESVETNKTEIEKDVDTQFKLARTTGLIVGIASLYTIADRRADVDTIYVALWSIVIIHCIIYLIYILFRNIKEESYKNRAYFQLSFLTSLFLFLSVFAGSKITPHLGSYLYGSCALTVTFQGSVKTSDYTPPPAPGTVKKEGNYILYNGVL